MNRPRLSFQNSRTFIVIGWLACALVFLTLQLVKSSNTPAQPSAPTQVKEIEGYRNWAKVNDVPKVMTPQSALSCKIWQAPTGVIVNGPDNPHHKRYVTVYVNAVGEDAMLNQQHPKFPEGSVIVKEKLAVQDDQTPELLTVMIKQKKGFNPASGDWEYMVVDGTGAKVEGRGKLQSCQDCHVANERSDYIFRTYLSAEVRDKLK
ncbi:MAG: cytochrome P460 family protein [Acidobacteria bacterium]|nr:cytochrome P460 family protein [Acidobacteriota bacterium]